MPKPVAVETITIAYVNEPQGRGPGSVKDTDGRYWKVWGDKLEEIDFRVGQSYAASYTSEEYRGKVQNTIIGAQPTAAPRTAAPARQAHINDSDRSEDIAVLALVKGWTDKIPVGDAAGLTHALRTCRTAWREYKKPVAPPAPQPQPVSTPTGTDFDDEIPY